MQDLLTEIDGGVALVTLNRPASMNALSSALRCGLVETLARLDDDPDVRVIVLTGAGRAFCAGLDVKELRASEANVTDNIEGGEIGATLSGLKKPIIAAINGAAVTGGFEMTLACDIVFAAESAYFADTHVKIGLLPGWGLSQRLSRTIGAARAKEISLTARKVSAHEAEALGFVNKVLPDTELLGAAKALARSIATWDPVNVAAMKSLIDTGLMMPLKGALEYEIEVSKRFNSGVVLGKS